MARQPAKRARRPRAPTAFVLDCSVVFAWYFADESSDYADAVAARLAKMPAIVPSLWVLEVANTLIVGERRGRCTSAQTSRFLQRLAGLPITIDERSIVAAWSEIIRIAREYNVSAYDAAYLEVALRNGLPLATLDQRLQSAAESLEIQRLLA